MRILQISSAKTFGGGERHVVDLARGLEAKGHEVFVALRPTNEWQDRFDFLAPERFLLVSIRNSFGMLSATRIARFAEQHKVDIIHAHVARDYLAASVAARSAKNVRLVLTRHVLFPMKPFHRFALRNVDAAIAVSPAVRVQLEKIFSPNKVALISNGIDLAAKDERTRSDLAAEFRRDHSIPDEMRIVSTLGELKVLKGQRDFVLAANEVLKTEPNVKFVVAGKDNTLDQHFRRELKRLVRVFGIEENFLWLDWLDDIRPLLAASDLFVSPSHSESFGLAILDAMAAGTPVLATDTEGAKELIGTRNILVPIKDPLALADAIRSLLADGKKLRELGETLRASAIERFGLEKMVDATDALYQKIVVRKT